MKLLYWRICSVINRMNPFFQERRYKEALEMLKDSAKEEDKLRKWKNAVLDMTIVNWTYRTQYETDPRGLLNALMVQAQQEAVDPAVNPDIRKLHDRIKELEEALAAANRRSGASR